MSNESNKQDIFNNALFDVEHALSMYADSFCTIPAEAIYDREVLAIYQEVIKSCHIYIVGLLPVIDFESAFQKNEELVTTMSLEGNKYDLKWLLPKGANLRNSAGQYYVKNEKGECFFPSKEAMINKLHQDFGVINFDVRYIGQAYGKDGSRNAIDRLLKHETLQKISLKGIPKGFRLSLLLLDIEPNRQLFTVFNPRAENKDDGTRIKAGLDKLFNTSEKERTTLYEASLIRYFSPKYNTEFKNSFPSTNLKVLQDCYKKDFSAIVAEICIETLPFRLRSEAVKSSHYHIAIHDLHKNSKRRIFFNYA